MRRVTLSRRKSAATPPRPSLCERSRSTSPTMLARSHVSDVMRFDCIVRTCTCGSAQRLSGTLSKRLRVEVQGVERGAETDVERQVAQQVVAHVERAQAVELRDLARHQLQRVRREVERGQRAHSQELQGDSAKPVPREGGGVGAETGVEGGEEGEETGGVVAVGRGRRLRQRVVPEVDRHQLLGTR